MATPVTITLYGENDEVKATYQRSIIPWGILKQAVKLNSEIDQKEVGEDDLDRIAEFVVAVFGDKFSVDDLNEGADIGDMIMVMRQIVSRATAVVNPTAPRVPQSYPTKK